MELSDNTHNCLMAVDLGSHGEASTRRNIPPLTHILIIGHPLSSSLHLQQSITSSVFSLRARQSSRTTSLQVLFCLPLGLGPSTSYSMHCFTQSSSFFRITCPYQCSLFCCNTNAMSSIPSLSAPYF